MSYSINTVNHSTTAWSRYYWAAPSDTMFTINTQPNDKLLAGNGQENLAWDQAIASLGAGGTEGYADGQVVWTSPNGKCFGVQIHVPTQILGMGTSPYYQVKTEPNGGWDGEHRGDPYNFDSKALGFDVVVKAVAGHQSLHVTITVNDI